jgi:hypothetical protein
VEDALKRQRAAKARFLAGSAHVLPFDRGRQRTPLSAVLGCDVHRRVADEMARFA